MRKTSLLKKFVCKQDSLFSGWNGTTSIVLLAAEFLEKCEGAHKTSTEYRHCFFIWHLSLVE